MSAVVHNLRPFQDARDHAKRAGADPRRAIAEVRAEQDAGRSGQTVCARYRTIAWHMRQHTPGGAA